LPLSNEVMVELLERHYCERYDLRKHDAEERDQSHRFTFSQTVSGALDWQRCEFSSDYGLYRWTGPGTSAVIDLDRLHGCDILLRVGLIGALNTDLVNSLKLVVNKEPIPLQRYQEESGVIVCESIVPRTLAEHAPFLNLVIQTAGMISPHDADPKNPDQRLLGVAVVWIEQKPDGTKE